MIDELQRVVAILKENNLKEISYSNDRIQIKVLAHDVYDKNIVQEYTNTNSVEEIHSVQSTNSEDQVISPIVGTCYLAPEPGANNFIRVGDTVHSGQPLLIIEAMKVMNYIKAPKDGVVAEIKVKNEQPVEFGQVLVIIK